MATLASILRETRHGVRLNEHLAHDCGLTVFQHAFMLGCEGIVSKRLGSRYRSGRTSDWLTFKNPQAPAVRREVEEDWGRIREALMSKVTALISDERPVIRIYGGDTDDHVEIPFETQSDANVAVERLNELFKTATGLVFRLGMRGT